MEDRIQRALDRASNAIIDLKAQAALLVLEVALKDYEQKRGFDPNQLRWPEGQWNGGRWRESGAVAAAGSFDEGRRLLCDDQPAIDLDICGASGSPECYSMIMERWDNCMRSVFVPPLRHTFPRGRK